MKPLNLKEGNVLPSMKRFGFARYLGNCTLLAIGNNLPHSRHRNLSIHCYRVAQEVLDAKFDLKVAKSAVKFWRLGGNDAHLFCPLSLSRLLV